MAFIERFVYSGGGAKAVVNIGMYQALIDLGLLPDVSEVAGASAGAITAAFVAIGMAPNDFREQLLKTNFKTLMGQLVGSAFGKNPSGISFLTRDGAPLEDFIRKNINETIKKHFKHPAIEEMVAKTPQLKRILHKLARENPHVTFADLDSLHHHFPAIFKKLVIIAVEFPTGGLQVFSSQSTPDVEIALACRASASIPVILQPTAIEINHEMRSFVDGGLFDNLPTDYFDSDKEGNYVKNQRPNQTLVFAFGEGLNDEKNQVFQALYGNRFDESIDEELMLNLSKMIVNILDKYIEKKEKMGFPKLEFSQVLKEFANCHELKTARINVLINRFKFAVSSLLQEAKKNKLFWEIYKKEKDEVQRIEILTQFVKSTLRPVLYEADLMEQLKRDFLTQFLGDLQSPYKNTAQKEAGYQKLRSEYPLRVVELRVSDLKTTDFEEAMRLARFMAASGYLDTVNYLTNHDLYNAGYFTPENFYGTLIPCFETIYQALLEGTGINPMKKKLFNKIASLRTNTNLQNQEDTLIDRQIYQEIKTSVEKRPDSTAAFALTRAVEFLSNNLDAENLFEEICLESHTRKRFSFYAFPGLTLFKSPKVNELKQTVSMFDSYTKETKGNTKSRRQKIFTVLMQMESFSTAYMKSLEKREGDYPPDDGATRTTYRNK